jgi:hypothetical protein
MARPRGRVAAYDVEAWGSDDDDVDDTDEGYSYGTAGRRRSSGGASSSGGSGFGGGSGVGRHCRWLLAGWLLALGLLAVWYSEHVSLNAQVVELTGASAPYEASGRHLAPGGARRSPPLTPRCAYARRAAGPAV